MALILIVEDEVAVRNVIRAALIKGGHQVIEAGDGRTGLAVIAEQSIDLVVTDVMMPERDGLEVIMELRAQKNSVPIIAMTGHPATTDLYLKMAQSLGAQRILAKPFSMEDLLRAINDLVPRAL